MRLSSRILVGCIALLGFSATAQKSDAAFTLDFAATNGSSIVFNGATDTFGFVDGTNGRTFEITGRGTGGPGPSIGLFGNITGTYTIGAITGVAPGPQTAPVSGTGTFSIFDGVTSLTANVEWKTILTAGAIGGANYLAEVNLTSIAYTGTNIDLIAIASATNDQGVATLTFQFGEATSLTTLTTEGGETSFSGSLTVDSDDPLNPVPAPAGLVLLATAIPVLGLRRVLRRKTATA